MAKKADNIFVKAKAYVKEHPRTSFQDAIQKVKGKKVSGKAKPKSVGKVTGTRARTTKATKVATTRKAPAGGTIARAKKILRDIDKLEAQRKEIKNRELKDIYALEINALHGKLKKLKRAS